MSERKIQLLLEREVLEDQGIVDFIYETCEDVGIPTDNQQATDIIRRHLNVVARLISVNKILEYQEELSYQYSMKQPIQLSVEAEKMYADAQEVKAAQDVSCRVQP